MGDQDSHEVDKQAQADQRDTELAEWLSQEKPGGHARLDSRELDVFMQKDPNEQQTRDFLRALARREMTRRSILEALDRDFEGGGSG